MNNFFRKLAIALTTAAAMGFSASVLADAAITNGTVSAAINNGGTFSVTYPGTPDFTPGLSYNGTEIINIDNPSTWWTLESSAGSTTAQYNSNPAGAITSLSGSTAATTLSTTFYDMSMLWTITSANTLAVTYSITNTGTSDLTGIYFGTGFDPDQGRFNPTGGTNATTNVIQGQGSDATVVSSALNAAGETVYAGLRNTTSAAAYDIRAYIGGDCCTAVSPSSVFSAGLQSPGFWNLADDSISLAYNIGTLGAGKTASIGYSYVFAPVPEPEIYAMMAAGLGLMGWVARRRKVQVVA
jgi:hypothetical protein